MINTSLLQNKRTLVILILIISYFATEAHQFFIDSTVIPKGYENASKPMQVFVYDFSMYITYVLLSAVILILVPKTDLLLLLVTVAYLLLWFIDLTDFILYKNQGYLNLKDYIIAGVFVIAIGFCVHTWKRSKNGKIEIINVTNLALLKWFIPKTEAEKALKNSQRNLELEQKLLRSQMNPHFIFNSLTSIQNYIYKEKPELAASYLGKFAKLMRLILENSRQEYIPFSKEIETLQLYLELQKVRFADKFDFQIVIDPLIDQDEVSIPPMFAQPFIENSLEHGIVHKSEQGQIKISFSLQDDYILFEVEDNGIGRAKAAQINKALKTGHHSYATTITEERLALIHEKSSL
ncbi:MAG TPA: histidine kinase, partial [Cytophagales bacterium]|nr:histidine kinase [Cytophagales bacterium]